MSEPKERGITFKPWGIEALLGGYKRSTMRVMPEKSQTAFDNALRNGWGLFSVDDGTLMDVEGIVKVKFPAPFGPVGTLIYAKETFRVLDYNNCLPWTQWMRAAVEYKADGFTYRRLIETEIEREQAFRYALTGAWKSGRYMPRWAARPQRWRITKITPMRANDTTEEIARGEGFKRVNRARWPGFYAWMYCGVEYPTALAAWRVAIEEIHPGILEKNLWMWLYDFEEVTT